ncbi:MAG TPA: 2,3-bisphosphoglycerate-independent phosphoglycerate mutase [Saprospiraceae bacterium]|nr:2,3-bisphosphoglycerate-independent phosphoglycerate mutase [Saprospiraceae bacterium]
MKKAMLVILDGWGLGPKHSADAIYNAHTPFFDHLMADYPHATLVTYGEDVGLPKGQMGNSEVGHLNIGAGRIVYQDFTKINLAIKDGSLATNQTLLDALAYAKKEHKKVHFIGLVSDGGIHSHINHLKALVEIAEANGQKNNFIHAFTDGRDTDPKSGIHFIKDLETFLAEKSTRIASVVGRFYAMDRDKRWNRIKLAYDLLRYGAGAHFAKASDGVLASYERGVTDEFIKPIVVTDKNDQPLATIEKDDVVIAFNFRTDRLRELTTVLTQQDMPEENMHTLPLYYVTMTRYDEKFKGIKVIFNKDDLKMTLGEYISSKGLTQLRTAETEKYAHVTFFFSGGREEPYKGEIRSLVPSPKVETYDLKPEMSCQEVTDKAIKIIDDKEPDLVVLNFANADMVGHTGVFEAAMKAAEAVDTQLKRLVTTAVKHDYRVVIIADHGNSDYIVNDDGTPNTAHSMSPVPIIVINPDSKNYTVKKGKLADVAPTILTLMELEVPKEMTGNVLVS